MLKSTLPVIHELAPLIMEHSDQAERERRLAQPVVNAFIDAGMFKLLLPAELGGAGANPLEFCEVIEAVSALDGSAGWCLMIGAGFGLFTGLLSASAAVEVYADRCAIGCGTFRPNGVARVVAGGFQVSGQWPLASGSSHATTFVGGCRIFDGDQPRLTSAGKPEVRLVFLAPSAVKILDTWDAAGLRGTASHDFVVQDQVVPAARSCWFSHPPTRPEPLYRLPAVAFFATAIASVSLGIARHAIELFAAFAAKKKPTWSQAPLSESAEAQIAVGRADGLVRSGRAFVTEALKEAWTTVTHGENLAWDQRGLLWLAGTQAATHAVEAVGLLFSAAGASAVYASTGLERCLRDVRTAAQHICVIPENFGIAGRLALGLDVSNSRWSIDDRPEDYPTKNKVGRGQQAFVSLAKPV